MSRKQSENIQPLPVMVYFLTILMLCITGLAVSAYLSFSHYRVYTDIGYKSFCAISKAINCDTVSESSYSIFMGIPVPIWGVAGYVFMLITILFSLNIKEKKMRLLSTLVLTAFIFSLISLYLGIISAVKIHSYCIMCIATYAVNFMLLYMFWLVKRRFENNNFIESFKLDFIFWKTVKTKALCAYLAFTILSLSTAFFLPKYWRLSFPRNTVQLNTGITEDGSPWIGAEHPELTIIEYADYMCFQCRKMHFFLRNLMDRYPEKIRVVHKHFPMDKRFDPVLKENLHPGSGILSLIAIYAATRNKFWKVNDFLYHYNMSKHAIYLRQIAKKTNLDLNLLKTGIHQPEIIQKLRRDIISGLKKNITGTPSYIINDKVYTGQIPSEILNSIIK